MNNPVLLNDLRKSWFRRRPVHAVALMAVAILVLTFLVIVGMPALFGFSQSTPPLWRFPDALLPIIAPIFAAGAFAREHEQRTWQDLLLTPLSAGEIVTGKFFASFFPAVATIVVLMPPLAMVLILSSVQWAQEPGPWMAAFGLRFLVSAVFYLAVGLVCSYHSTNARTSLVVGYVALALYGMASFFVWRMLVVIRFLPANVNTHGSIIGSGEQNGLMTLARGEFGMSRIDLYYMLQCILLCFILFAYLLFRVRQRRVM